MNDEYTEQLCPPRIRLGMVGGGEGALIGGVHRIAARIDDRFELVAGALSSTPERARSSARAIGLDPDRSYDSFQDMAEAEAARDDGIEAVAIVTPNHVHADAAKAFLAHGIHVICDKPLTSTLDDAQALVKTVEDGTTLFILTHNYTGYPLIRQARRMVESGDLGKIRLVQVEYAQDWLSEPVEHEGLKQAEWRTDPARSGAGGCVGDIGTHAYNLAGFVSGLTLESLSADMQSFVPGRKLDDNVHVMLRYHGGARGMLWSSQVAVGHENGLRLRVYGEKASIDWSQEEPNKMWFSVLGEARRLLTRNGAGADAANAAMSRVPGGHPEGYFEAFANIYVQAAEAIQARRDGVPVAAEVLFPTVQDGLDGMKFIDACVRSSGENGSWIEV